MQTTIAAFGCDPDETALLKKYARRHGAEIRITRKPLSGESAAWAEDCLCASVGHKTPVDGRALEKLAGLGVRYLSTRSIGVNHIDLAAAREMGIVVENVAYSPEGIADYALMLLLMAARGAGETIRRVERKDFRLGESRGRELREMTVGVAGAGRIGRSVLKRLEGFGCRTLVSDPGRADSLPLEALLARCDALTLHMPLTESTYHLIDREKLARMRRGAILVNTARGALVDAQALADALEEGHLGGAGLDVVEGEEGFFYRDCSHMPLESRALRRLLSLPNVVVTPHTAFYTERALRDIAENTILNCLEYEGSKARWIS